MMDLLTIATAALVLSACYGTESGSSTAGITNSTNASTPTVFSPTLNPSSSSTAPPSSPMVTSDHSLTSGELAAAIAVPLVVGVVAVVAIIVYFLWFRHWLLRRRQGRDDGQEHGKVHIDAAGDAAPAMLRYAKNPSLKHRQEQAESMTAGYAAVGDHAGVFSEEPDYENLGGKPRAVADEDPQAMYENVRSKSAAAKTAKAAAASEAKASKQGLKTKDEAVPSYRAPAPPPQDVTAAEAAAVTAVPAEGGSTGGYRQAAASDPDTGVATYVKLVGVAATNQPATKSQAALLSPKNLPSSGTKPQHAQMPQSSAGAAASGRKPVIGTAAATAAGGKPSKGKVPAVALRPPGLAGKAKPEPATTEDDTYVVPEADAAFADLERPTMKPMTSVTSEDSQLYIEPQGDDVYENY